MAYYDGIVITAEYFINAMLPITMGKMDAILTANNSVVKMHTKSFGCSSFETTYKSLENG